MSEIPKYQSISNDLRDRIAAGEFTPGERLPAQHALAETYGVTVMTLRQALAELEAEGLVHASKGKGTFVSEPPSVRYDLDHLWSFTQQMTHQGVNVTTDVLAVRFDSNPHDAGSARLGLGLAEDEQVVELVRCRSIGDEPVVVQRSFLSASIWSRVASADFASTSLYDVLRERCGLNLDRASETIRAVALNDHDAALLCVDVGQPSLESIRISRSSDGIAFLYDRALMNGEATEIRTERTTNAMHVAYQAVPGSSSV